MTNLEPKAAPLYAGAAQVDITPKMGIQLDGNVCLFRPARFVLDPLYAKALVLKTEHCKLCLLSLDLLNVTQEWADEIRRRVSEELSIDRNAIMVHDTQNHSSPSLGQANDRKLFPPELWWAKGGDERYPPFAVPRILEAVRKAADRLEPAWIGAASGIDGRVAFNRRWVMRDGTVRMNPMGDPNLRYPEGPADPEVGVVCIQRENLQPVAMLLHHTCHPVSGLRVASRNCVTAGWPGAWSDCIKKAYGQHIVPLVINGCCGNISPANPIDPHWVSDHQRMGRQLAETTDGVLKRITYSREVVLDRRSRHLMIPIRELPAEEVEEARKLLEVHPDPIWDDEEHTRANRTWLQAVSAVEQHAMREANPDLKYDYEVQVLRLGDIGLVAIPGEPFVEGQLEIKLRSPAYPTYVAHHCHSYIAYVPTKRAFQRSGGHETTPHTARLCLEALEMIVENSVELLGEVFGSE